MGVTKALSDENRVRVIMALQDGELCVCQLIHLLELAPSTVSKHTSILYQAGLVEWRKEGRWVYYRLVDKTASAAASGAIAWLRQSLGNDPRIAEDRKKLKTIRSSDLRELCKRYMPRCSSASPGGKT